MELVRGSYRPAAAPTAGFIKALDKLYWMLSSSYIVPPIEENRLPPSDGT